MNLNKDPSSWAHVKAAAALAGSDAQAFNVLEMALQDIAKLAAANEVAAEALRKVAVLNPDDIGNAKEAQDLARTALNQLGLRWT